MLVIKQISASEEVMVALIARPHTSSTELSGRLAIAITAPSIDRID